MRSKWFSGSGLPKQVSFCSSSFACTDQSYYILRQLNWTLLLMRSSYMRQSWIEYNVLHAPLFLLWNFKLENIYSTISFSILIIWYQHISPDPFSKSKLNASMAAGQRSLKVWLHCHRRRYFRFGCGNSTSWRSQRSGPGAWSWTRQSKGSSSLNSSSLDYFSRIWARLAVQAYSTSTSPERIGA